MELVELVKKVLSSAVISTKNCEEALSFSRNNSLFSFIVVNQWRTYPHPFAILIVYLTMYGRYLLFL